MNELLHDMPMIQHMLALGLCILLGLLLRWISGGLIKRLALHAGIEDGDILARNAGTVIIWCSLLIGVHIVIPSESIPSNVRTFVLPLLISLIVLVIASALGRTTKSMLKRYGERRGNLMGSSLLQKCLLFSIYVLALIFILDAFGIKVTTIIATLGIGGLALALALQETLTNLFAGMYIAIAHQIRVGDFVSFDGNEGTIKDIGWRNTVIRKSDESMLISPNSKLAQAIVSAYAFDAAFFRARLSVLIGVDENLASAESILKREVSIAIKSVSESDSVSHIYSGLLTHPEAVVRVGECKDGSVELVISYSVSKHSRIGEIRSELFKQCKDALEQGGIRLHNPHRARG